MRGKRSIAILSLITLATCISGCNKQFNMNEIRTLEPFIFTNEIQDIKSGFSYVMYEGNDGFSNFIRKGGASSDEEVVQYLTSFLLASEVNINFSNMPFGCSTLSIQGSDDDMLFGRNFDWQRCNALVVQSTPLEGYRSISTVNRDFIQLGSNDNIPDQALALSALYAPLDGMNEKGFCISVNMIQDQSTIQQDYGKSDLTTTTAVRLLLNSAATVDEAISILQQYDLHSSMGMMVHFAMTDLTGRSVVIEYIDNNMIVTETPVVTNFYLSEGPKKGIGTEQSHERYDLLMKKVELGTLSAEEVKDALDQVSKHNFVDPSTTEWSIVFHQNSGLVEYYHREDYTTGYTFKISNQVE